MKRFQLFPIFFSIFAYIIQIYSDEKFQSGSYTNYVKVLKGSPGDRVLITAPHGGKIKPRDMKKRKIYGCKIRGVCKWGSVCNDKKSSSRCKSVITQDKNSYEIAEQIRENLQNYGISASMVLMKVHRSRIDANRVGSEACQGYSKCNTIYQYYHSAIRDAINTWSASKPGLIIDVHGQAHPQNWIELGYGIKKAQLNAATLSNSLRSSIESLQHRMYMSTASLIRGSNSMGALLQRVGYSSVPSPRHTGPGRAKYFRGGPTIQMYGMRARWDCVDAIQFELPSLIRNVPEAQRTQNAKRLAWVIYYFYSSFKYKGGHC